jgi:hypothetical protein
VGLRRNVHLQKLLRCRLAHCLLPARPDCDATKNNAGHDYQDSDHRFHHPVCGCGAIWTFKYCCVAAWRIASSLAFVELRAAGYSPKSDAFWKSISSSV